MGNLGTIARLEKKFDDALKFHREALGITRSIGHKEGEAQDLANLALIFRDQRDAPKALAHLKDALRIAEDIHQPEIIWRIHAGLSSVYRRMNETEFAVTELELAVEGFEGIRGRLLRDEEKLIFVGLDKIGVYGQLVQMLHDPIHRDARAFDYVERARARLFLDQLAHIVLDRAFSESPANYMEVKKLLINESEERIL